MSRSEWGKGDAGDNFRDRVDGVRDVSRKIADSANTVASAVEELASALTTVKCRMDLAASIAAHAGLVVEPRVVDPEWIGDPVRKVSTGPISLADEIELAKQQEAYAAALELASEGRVIEEEAHAALRQALTDEESFLAMLRADLIANSPWLVAQAVVGTIGEAVKHYDKWTDVAQTRAANVATYRTIASEAVSETYRRAAIGAMVGFAGGVGNAENAAAFNARLAGGNPNARVPRLAAMTLDDLIHTGGKIAPRIPVIGTGITVLQTGHEIATTAEDGGDVARITTKNTAGLIVGSAASAALFTAGAPVWAIIGGGLVLSYGATLAVDKVLK
ncbi:hypothetical protein G4H71_14090 [Rhodococcus triatomae]|uniref:Uncharacterized protein n=1 Tax=Rhodococcus triatomae TaxID=300028 RepID=A0A1G8NU67_9NOCA|nr:hypothetical protein [Rhodococcus triatomae]QNG20077.1 hypothetical protein G4H72_16285 [Rhodococcus triatomae]QNG24007.1 hypothetical protein G4H71_14090 [Rhodococcus triatomae]SDI83040.1 hypothetical protein SAMN05444695_111158 [Rhodococcus triatomae]